MVVKLLRKVTRVTPGHYESQSKSEQNCSFHATRPQLARTLTEFQFYLKIQSRLRPTAKFEEYGLQPVR